MNPTLAFLSLAEEVKSLPREAALAAILARCVELAGARGGAIYMLSTEEENLLVCTAQQGPALDQDGLNAIAEVWQSGGATATATARLFAAGAEGQPPSAIVAVIEPAADAKADLATAMPVLSTIIDRIAVDAAPPVAGGPAEAPPPSPDADAGDLPDGVMDVLVVEDNVINLMLVETVLKRGGHKVTSVENGLLAVNTVREHVFDLILMDIHMPEMDGLEATARIREMEGPQAGIPIIAVTANAMEGDRERFLAGGMDDYLPKPIDADNLLQMVRDYGRGGARSGPSPHARSNGGGAVGVLDERAIGGLIAKVGEAVTGKMVEAYVNDTPLRLRRLLDAVSRSDAARARSEAEDLSSSSAELGVPVMRDLGLKLSQACAGSDWDEARALGPRLQSSLDDALEALQARFS